MNISVLSFASSEKKERRSEVTMNKKTAKKCFGGLIASLLLATWPAALVEAEITSVARDQTDTTSCLSSDYAGLNLTILLKVKELSELNSSLPHLQSELQDLLNDMSPDVQHRGQPSMSLRGFYQKSIFSARGFA